MMSVYNKKFIQTFLLALLIATVAGRAFEPNTSGEGNIYNDAVVIKAEESLRQLSGPTIHHFARHNVCNHRFGKVRFFKALADYFQNISDNMKIAFVLDICKRRDQMLTKWVQEIFDKDGDGYISHFEMEIYR
ncbi:hypothetical protein MAR_035710 [Mya arenaria]|uniref:EF-hand domain-containing protein n=1 Tax=Mya arenaria TaxID=6604 RepID=A0ABY7ENI1_MYAAR|nr:uncharacterized protein LOC128241637 [Mya arenaria]XP_052814610.1 uncharacterized protein LOC128241637 [Mya arenaria]WAR10634.1 hypothetical protein MAR_035710 [Mya arenaria]